MGRLALFALLFGASFLTGAGMHLPGIGARGISMGGAYRASCDDATAVYWNPAAISQLPDSTGNNILLNMQLIRNDFRFDAADTLVAAVNLLREGESSMTSPSFVVPHLFSAHRFPGLDNFHFGMGIYSPFGIASTWDVLKDDDLDYVVGVNGRSVFPLLPDSMFQFSLTEELPEEDFSGRITAFTFSPSVAVDIGERLSLGASFLYTMSSFELTMPSIDSSRIMADTGVVFQDAEMMGSSVGINAGIVYSPVERLRLAATVRAEQKIRYEGDYRDRTYKFYNEYLSGLLGGSRLAGGYVVGDWTDAWAYLPRPLQLGCGLAWDVNDDLTVEFDYSFTDWSVMDTLSLLTSDTDSLVAVIPMNWEDSNRFSVGAEYRLSNSYALRGGLFYEPHPAVPEFQNLFLPDFQDQVAVNLGFGASWGSLDMDLSGELEYFGEKTIEPNFENGGSYPVNIPGDYTGWVGAVTLGLTYKF